MAFKHKSPQNTKLMVITHKRLKRSIQKTDGVLRPYNAVRAQPWGAVRKILYLTDLAQKLLSLRRDRDS